MSDRDLPRCIDPDSCASFREDRERMRAEIARLKRIETAAAKFVKYGGVGKEYPFDRLGDLLDSERGKCKGQDNRDYWMYLRRDLDALAAALKEKPE